MGGETFLNNNWILLRFNKIFIKVYVRQVLVYVRRNFIFSRHYVRQVLKNYLQPCNIVVYVMYVRKQDGNLIDIYQSCSKIALHIENTLNMPYFIIQMFPLYRHLVTWPKAVFSKNWIWEEKLIATFAANSWKTVSGT